MDVRFSAILLVALCVGSSNAGTPGDLPARATAAREANNLTEAIKLYREALANNPKWQEGWWFLGTILYDTNSYIGCRDALKRFVELKADAAPAWGILGLCEFQNGEYAPSLTHIQRSLALGSSEQSEMEKVLRFHEAILLTHAGKFEEAIQKYVWFLHGTEPSSTLLSALGLAALRTPIVPKDIPPDQQDLFKTAGAAAFAQMSGDGASAHQIFVILLERYPRAHHVHYLYAFSLLASNPDEAIKEYHRELENTPASGGTLAMLAWSLLNRGDSTAALPYAEKAVRSEPSYALAQYVLGRSLVENNAVDDGIKHLELAERMDPANLENHLSLAAAYPRVRRYRDARRERQRSLELTKDAGPVRN